MNFYYGVVDEPMRYKTDKPTIGVSGFELTRALPETLQSSLPSIEQIEKELAGSDE